MALKSTSETVRNNGLTTKRKKSVRKPTKAQMKKYVYPMLKKARASKTYRPKIKKRKR